MSLPVITTQPADVTIYVGQTAVFNVAANSDNGALTYQWDGGTGTSGASLGTQDGAQTATLSIANEQLNPYDTYFSAVVTNASGNTTSRSAKLTVLAIPAPTITSQPQPASVAVGGSATFSAAATTVVGTLTWQWFKGNSALAGATSASYTIANVTASSAGNYHVVVGNGSSATTTSNTVALTVTPAGTGTSGTAPDITSQPVSITAAAGSVASFSVGVTSTAGVAGFQWSKDGVAIAKATNATLIVFGVSTASAGSYRVAVTNRAGTTTSASATLSIGTAGAGGTTGGAVGPMATWTVSAGQTALNTAALGITEITRHRANAATDTCVLMLNGRNVDAAALFGYGTTVAIGNGAVPWFVGRVTETPASGDGKGESQRYTLSGPWWYLEHLVFTQTWTTQAGQASALLGRAILGQALDGSAVTTGHVIVEALNYAVAAGAPFRVGAILEGFTIPFDEVKDVTCAEVIRKMLRWHPDAVAWFDYSSGTPTFNVVPRAQLSAVTLTKGSAPLVSIGDITSRDDLTAPSVVICYEITGKNNSSTYTDVSVDAAPQGATGQEFGAVVLTIPLRGQSSTTVTQPVIVVPIEDGTENDDGTPNADLVDFLVARCGGELAQAANDPDIGVEGISITSISRDLQDPNAVEYDPTDPDGDPIPVDFDDSLGNMLVGGSITEAMKQRFALVAQAQRLTFSYTLDSGSGDSNGPSGADYGDVSDERTMTLDIIATNAVTQPYTVETSYDPGDTAPTGLAANYLAALNVLQWAGNVVLEEQTAGGTVSVGLGNLLNIAGSANAAWAAMAALIVQESVQASTGRTTLTFGPSKHLSPTEMIARLRTTRPGGRGGRESTGGLSTANSGSRSTGLPNTKNAVGLGTSHPMQNSTPVPPPSQTAASDLPFAPLAPDNMPQSEVAIQINQFSYLRSGECTTSTIEVVNLGNDIGVSAGDYLWIEVGSSDNVTPDSAGLDSGPNPPWLTAADDDTELLDIEGDGSDNPFLWNGSYYPIAKVVASNGDAAQGGIVFTSQDGTLSLEVVPLVNTHLAMKVVLPNGVYAMIPVPSAGYV